MNYDLVLSELHQASTFDLYRLQAAIGKLQAFVNAVFAQRGQKIPEDAADRLIDAAEAIIVVLSW